MNRAAEVEWVFESAKYIWRRRRRIANRFLWSLDVLRRSWVFTRDRVDVWGPVILQGVRGFFALHEELANDCLMLNCNEPIEMLSDLEEDPADAKLWSSPARAASETMSTASGSNQACDEELVSSGRFKSVDKGLYLNACSCPSFSQPQQIKSSFNFGVECRKIDERDLHGDEERDQDVPTNLSPDSSHRRHHFPIHQISSEPGDSARRDAFSRDSGDMTGGSTSTCLCRDVPPSLGLEANHIIHHRFPLKNIDTSIRFAPW